MATKNSSSVSYPVVVEGHGPVPCPFMVIGEAPGREEIKEGKPFVGRSGQLLRATLSEFGVGDVYITNAFKGDVGEGNRNPSDEELRDHWDLLVAELLDVDPAGVLLVGAVATRTILGDIARMQDLNATRHSYALTPYTEEINFFPCYHPAFILRNSRFKEDFRHAVARFALTTEVLARYESRRSFD